MGSRTANLGTSSALAMAHERPSRPHSAHRLRAGAAMSKPNETSPSACLSSYIEQGLAQGRMVFLDSTFVVMPPATSLAG